MTLRHLRVVGYRSVRDLSLRLDRVNVLVGPNGSGKTNLYRALGLLHAAAQGRLARTLADEGGMPSVLWAGARTAECSGCVPTILENVGGETRIAHQESDAAEE